jgi:hypothetical protein
VVTVLFTNADFENALLRKGAARPVLNARENMTVWWRQENGSDGESNREALRIDRRTERCWPVEMALVHIWPSAVELYVITCQLRSVAFVRIAGQDICDYDGWNGGEVWMIRPAKIALLLGLGVGSINYIAISC